VNYYEFVELMDDDFASLIGLTVLLRGKRTLSRFHGPVTVTQLTLSLYLLVKCQFGLKFGRIHSADSLRGTLAAILDWIATALDSIPASEFVDHLMLKLAERKSIMYMYTHAEPALHAFNLGFAFDITRGLQVTFTHARSSTDPVSALWKHIPCFKIGLSKNGERAVWLCDGAGSALSGVHFRHLPNGQSADALTAPLETEATIEIPIKTRR